MIKPEDLAIALEAAADQANLLITLALAIVGGSIFALLQTSYLRPRYRRFRAAYLVFVPGWFFLGRSIYYGSKVREVYLAHVFGSKESAACLISQAGHDTLAQSQSLFLGLVMFAIWLALYLGWWISTDKPAGMD